MDVNAYAHLPDQRCTGVHKLVLLNDGVHDEAEYLNRYGNQLLV
jgi:hypothetical protein